MLLDLARMSGVELAVNQRVEQDLCFVASHCLLLFRQPRRSQHGARAREP